MKVTEEKLEDGTVLLEAIVSPMEISRAYNMGQYALAHEHGIVINEGDMPAILLTQKLGIKNLDPITQSHALEYLVPFVLTECNIVPAYIPTAIDPAPLRRDKPYTLRVKVEPKQDYELTSYEPVTISYPEVKIPESHIDTQIEKMSERFSGFAEADPHPVGEGDTILITLDLSQNGNRIEELSTSEGRTYVLGANLMPVEFDAGLLGMEAGQTKSFSFAPATPPGLPDLEPVDCTVTVIQMQKRVAATINDEWVAQKMPQYGNLEGLRAEIMKTMMADAEARLHKIKLQQASDEISKRFQGEIPESVMEGTKLSLLANLKGQVQQEGTPFEQYVEKQGGMEKVDKYLTKRTRELLENGYALDAIYRHENLSFTEKDVEEACLQMDPKNPDDARSQLEDFGRGFALHEAAERVRANAWLVENAICKIIEK